MITKRQNNKRVIDALLSTLAVFSLYCSSFAYATGKDVDQLFYFKSEFHDQNVIYSIGTEFLLQWPHSNIGVAINSSINAASIVDKKNTTQEFITAELGGRFGYFSDLSVFIEAGVDLGEGLGNLLHSSIFERNDDRQYSYHNSDYDDNYEYPFNVDSYIGLGVGVNLNKTIRLEGFSRFREINGTDWDAKSQIYSGVTFALIF